MVERLDEVADGKLQRLEQRRHRPLGAGRTELHAGRRSNGKVEIAKAVEINEAFQVTRQFWPRRSMPGVLKNPRSFINSTPHMSFVWGDDNIAFLRKRYEALKASPLFCRHGILQRSGSRSRSGSR